MGDRGLESEGLAGELNKNEDVDAGRHFEEEKVVNLKWIVEQGKGGKKEQVASQSWVDYETRYWPI